MGRAGQGDVVLNDLIRIVGVLNVTPDSFSDGGRYLDHARAVEHGLALRADGADFVDVGGESTRPGASPVEPDEELRRVLPVVRDLVAAGVPVSIDTRRSVVAAAAIDAGATIVNDVSGTTDDPGMAAVVARSDARLVVMHSAGPAGVPAVYGDVVADVREEIARRVGSAVEAGVAPERILVDPGIGFSKGAAENWELLRRIDELTVLGLPVLVGVSRKRFLRTLVTEAGVEPHNDALDAATSTITAGLANSSAVWGVRVHDVAASRVAAAAARRLSGRDAK